MGTPLDEEIFNNLRPAIAKDIIANFHQENTDGSSEPLPEHGYEHYDWHGFQSLFISIQRRSGGGHIREATEANRLKVHKEFLRMTWPKTKPPEVSSWYVCVHVSTCVCVFSLSKVEYRSTYHQCFYHTTLG